MVAKIALSFAALAVLALAVYWVGDSYLTDEEAGAVSASSSTTAESFPEAYGSLMDSADDLEAARESVENLDVHSLLSEPTVVTEEYMADLAAMPIASPELRDFAERVAAGECHWSDIEVLARPLPHEVAELKESPNFVWTW
ncbi:hypothetical protein OG921_02675 [Aldersonia sp. NBC_00410]|nr:hypothetical protein [Aldersonia sp. NBC_00410]